MPVPRCKVQEVMQDSTYYGYNKGQHFYMLPFIILC